jgi:hypothetical protein
MGVNFRPKRAVAPMEFNRCMRMQGEYTKARLDGLYARYLAGDTPDYVVAAIRHAVVLEQDDDEADAPKRVLVHKSLRHQAVLSVVRMLERSVSVDEVVNLVGMGMDYRQVVMDTRRLIADKQLSSKTGSDGRRYYKAVGDSK